MLWCPLDFLSSLLNESDISVLALLPRDHRPLGDDVGDCDIKSGRVFLVTLPPGLPGMSAHPAVARFVDLDSATTFSTIQRGVRTGDDLIAQLLV